VGEAQAPDPLHGDQIKIFQRCPLIIFFSIYIPLKNHL
jgi:hypothetical protein